MDYTKITERINEGIREDCLSILAEHEEDGEDIMLATVIAAIRARDGELGLQIKIELACDVKGDDAA